MPSSWVSRFSTMRSPQRSPPLMIMCRMVPVASSTRLGGSAMLGAVAVGRCAT